MYDKKVMLRKPAHGANVPKITTLRKRTAAERPANSLFLLNWIGVIVPNPVLLGHIVASRPLSGLRHKPSHELSDPLLHGVGRLITESATSEGDVGEGVKDVTLAKRFLLRGGDLR